MNIVKLNNRCPMCGKVSSVSVNETDVNKYMNGGLVQNCFPYLNIVEREILISGTCKECQEFIFGPYNEAC